MPKTSAASCYGYDAFLQRTEHFNARATLHFCVSASVRLMPSDVRLLHTREN